VFWLVASDSWLYPSVHRPDVGISWALPQALASSGILLPSRMRLAPPLRMTRLTESNWGLLRSPSPLLEPLGRHYPPGLMTVPTGQSDGCQRLIFCRFGSSASAFCAGLQSRWLKYVFAFAVHRFLLSERSG
jgi:hypothetical protein